MEGIKIAWKRSFADLKANDYVVLLLITSAFVSVFLQTALMVLLPLYALLSRQGKKLLPKKKSDFLLIAFSLVAMLSTLLFSKDAVITDGALVKAYLKLLSVGIFILCFDIFFFVSILRRRSFLLGLKLSAVLSITSFAVAVYQKAAGIFPDPIQRPGRVASVFMNENYYGTIIEFIALICLYFIFRSESLREKIFFAIVYAMNVFGLWLCQSRMAYIVVALSFLLFLFVFQRRAAYIVMIILAGFSSVLIRFPALLPRFDSILSYLDFRLGIWDCAFRAFRLSPWIGRGYYSYSSIWTEVFAEEYFPALHAHNLYIELLINFGIIGFLLLSLFVLNKIFSCLKICYQQKDSLSIALIGSAALCIAVHGCADITIFWPQTGIFAALLFASPQVYVSKEDFTE